MSAGGAGWLAGRTGALTEVGRTCTGAGAVGLYICNAALSGGTMRRPDRNFEEVRSCKIDGLEAYFVCVRGYCLGGRFLLGH